MINKKTFEITFSTKDAAIRFLPDNDRFIVQIDIEDGNTERDIIFTSKQAIELRDFLNDWLAGDTVSDFDKLAKQVQKVREVRK